MAVVSLSGSHLAARLLCVSHSVIITGSTRTVADRYLTALHHTLLSTSEGALQVVIGRLLQHLCILQTLDQLQLLLLHPLDHLLMLDPLLLLLEHLVLDLLLRPVLLLHQLPLLLLLRLLLLRPDHLLQRVVLQVLLVPHHMHEVLLLLLLLLHGVCLTPDLLLHLPTLHLQSSPLFLFDFECDLSLEGLLVLLLLLDGLPLRLLLHVALPRYQDIRRPLLRLVELLPRLQIQGQT